MKNIFRLLLFFTALAALATSCMKDEDEITASPECVITNFSISDINTDIVVKLANGNDTTITKTIGGANVSFNIDHINGKIYAVDSLPNWTDITNVVPSLSSTGYVYVKEHMDEDFRQFANGSDSVDFTQPVQFRIIASDGVSSKDYTAYIWKKESETDSLAWKAVEGSDLQVEGMHRSLAFADRIYVFSESAGMPTVTSSSFLSEGASWRKPEQMVCEQGTIDWKSVVVFGGYLYALNSEGYICQSTNDARGVEWTVASDRTFARLLGADGYFIYACDDDAIWGSSDMLVWNECGSYDMDMLPEEWITTVSYTSRTNPNIRNAVMAGLSSQNADKAVVWYKVSSLTAAIDQDWNYIQVTEENKFGCPRLEGMSMAYHKGCILAIGGNNEGIYISEDNGITWHLQTSMKMLPSEVAGQAVPATIANGNGYLWLIQSGGRIWRGKIG